MRTCATLSLPNRCVDTCAALLVLVAWIVQGPPSLRADCDPPTRRAPAGTLLRGRLDLDGEPLDGRVDLRLCVFADPERGSDAVVRDAAVVEDVVEDVDVRGGLFAVEFGCADELSAGAFGGPRWLEVSWRRAGEPDFRTLSPRHAIGSAPRARLARALHTDTNENVMATLRRDDGVGNVVLGGSAVTGFSEGTRIGGQGRGEFGGHGATAIGGPPGREIFALGVAFRRNSVAVPAGGVAMMRSCIGHVFWPERPAGAHVFGCPRDSVQTNIIYSFENSFHWRPRPLARDAVDVSVVREAFSVWSEGGFGVGTSTPRGALHVGGRGRLLLDSTSPVGTWMTLANTAGGGSWSFIQTAANNSEGSGKLLIRDDRLGANGVTMAMDGEDVGLGTVSPRSRLHIVHASGQWGLRLENATQATFRTGMRVTDDGFFEITNRIDGGIPARLNSSGSWTAASDRRLKRDVRTASGLLASMESLRPVTYRWRADVNGVVEPELGLIADELERSLPELVEDGPTRRVDYARLGAVAVGALEELEKILERREEELRAEEGRLAKLEAELARLERTISTEPATR